MERERFGRLLQKYLDDHLEGEELDEFLREVNGEAHTGQIKDTLLRYLQDEETPAYKMDNSLSEKTIRKISASLAFTDKSLRRVHASTRLVRVGIAAAVISVLFTALFLFRSSIQDQHQQMVVQSKGVFMRNDGVDTSRHMLPDGSFVTLYPGSEVNYLQKADGSTRTLILTGKAFFDVRKDPQRPFVVYSGPIITRVLGTSFWVDQKSSGDVEIEVRSGRVQVFENNEGYGTNDKTGTKIILHPNHKTLYRSEKHFFESGIVAHPIPLRQVAFAEGEAPPASTSYVYQRANLASIIQELEKEFGIEIVLERESIGNCLFTGDLNGEDLFSMLNILCMTTNARYQINETQILITGNGCEQAFHP